MLIANQMARCWVLVTLVWGMATVSFAGPPTISMAPDELPLPVAVIPKELANPWPAAWEKEYIQRVRMTLSHFKDVKLGGGTYGENEKNFYATAMMALLNNRVAEATKALQEPDHEKISHQHTKGVDFYWCFTLKHQMRKYFFFRDFLTPEYRQQMFEGAKIWTSEDPLRRPHPVYGSGGKSGVWGPEAKGSWVDVRSTDNLRAMRDTSVYLMAEETGNIKTRDLYKERIRDYVRSLYHVGMMEWDSENYHSHTLAPYHNLYDFAKDTEVRLLAKAALDWLYAAAAVKYYRGAFTGPNCRDYGNSNVVFGANVCNALWLYFGNSPQPDPHGERDAFYYITSSYRPPQAVVELARKNFQRPVEILATKPLYELWIPGKYDSPRYWETTYIGRSFQLGSIQSAEPETTWNVSPMKLVTNNKERGADFWTVNSSALLGHATKNAGDQIVQYGPLLIWMRPAKDSKFECLLPQAVPVKRTDDLWLYQYQECWLAVRPINLRYKQVSKPAGKLAEKYAQEQIEEWVSTQSEGYCGFALEVGEAPQFKDAASFEQAIRAKQKLDLNDVKSGDVALTGTNNQQLRIKYNQQNDLPMTWRNGKLFEQIKSKDLYRSNEEIAPIGLGWQEGRLLVEAGGKTFRSMVTREGKASFDP
jgi:hypothetical protein